MTEGAVTPLPRVHDRTTIDELRHAKFPELMARLERIRASAVDVVADSRDLALVPPTGGNGWGTFRVPGYGDLPLSRHAAVQLAEHTGIPTRYADRMADALPDLLAENVNRWLQAQPARRLVRMAEDKVRAVLSDRYHTIDNYDVAFLVAERAQSHGAQVLTCSLTEERMSIRITVPNAATDIRAGDRVVPGLLATNSEVGAGAFSVEPYVYRLLCQNGLVGEASLYRVHLGAKLEVGQIDYQADTQQADAKAFLLKTRDVVDSTFDPATLARVVARLRGATEVLIHEPVRVLERHMDALDLTEDARKALLLAMGAANDYTAYGLVQAITATARDAPTVDEELRLQRYAGRILDTTAEAVA